ncbi:MAG TPA: M3 family oligoendopeptidase, partial [Halanaerobiales bacterium]|nr:M3 family oligoendopeptidase [Halanaerobiales bacterium]
MAKELPQRNEISDDYKWHLEDIYESDDNWEEDFIRTKDLLKKAGEYQGSLVSSAEKLSSGLNLIINIQEITGRLYSYAHMRKDEDTGNQKNQALYNRVQGLFNEVNSVVSFMVPEILTLSREKIEGFLTERDDLKVYQHLLDNIMRQKKHYLSVAEEKILAMAGDVVQGPDNTFSMLNDADLVFPTIKDENGEDVRVTHGRFIGFMQNHERQVRRDAFKALYSKYNEFSNTFASTLQSSVKGDIFYARSRKYNSALEAALDDDNVPVDVYENLIVTVKKNIDAMHRYISLRKDILALDELHMYDIYTPLVPELDIKVPFNQAKEMVVEGLSPLGEEYLENLKKGFENNWIDVYENKGKRSGAYSSGCYGVHPYVLLNYTENLDNVFTLAHEIGHALHTYYSNEN